MNDQAKRMTGLAVACAFAAALSLAAANDKAAAADGDQEKCYGVAKTGENDCHAGRARAVPEPRRSTIRAIPGRSCRKAPASPWSFPATARAASSRSTATCPRLSAW